MKIIILTISLFTAQLATSQLVGSFTDERDGRTYKTVEFTIPTIAHVGMKRVWIGENIDYKTPSSLCYNNNDSYCEAYGRIYTYEEAREACPEGWRLPTATEWNELFDLFGGIDNAARSLSEGGRSKLDLLYNGFAQSKGAYSGIEKEGYYWQAEGSSTPQAGLIVIRRGTPQVYNDVTNKSHHHAVRCIQE